MPRRFTFRATVIFLLLTSLMLSADSFAAKKKQRRTMNTVKREQQATQKSIKENTRKLDANVRKTERELLRLNALEGELRDKNREIDDIRTTLVDIDNNIKLASDTMSVLESQLAGLKAEYARALRKMQGSYRANNLLSFLFSSKSFSDAAARYRYMKEIARWRKRKVNEITAASARVESQRRQLGTLHDERSRTLSSLSVAENELRNKRDETDRTVASLKKEGSRLKQAISKNQKRLKSLDSELDRMIVAEQKRIAEAERRAEQQRKEKERKAAAGKGKKNNSTAATTSRNTARETSGNAASRALSGSFESNKGRLLFPVRGRYTIVRGFGRMRHPELPEVVIDNPGIDISANDGARARSIFEGTVSGIFSQDGFNKVVMVRHGSYISIYANLSSINVKVGDKVRANQDLGTIYRDPQYDNRPVLHFELRRERSKLNPLQWIK